MKKNIALVVFVLIIAIGMLTGCGSKTGGQDKDFKGLTDCLSMTKNVDSMEADVSTDSKEGGQAVVMKMNMKVEDLKKDVKFQMSMDMDGQKQEFYMGKVDGKTFLYVKDTDGKYSSQEVSEEQLKSMDLTKSFDAYIEIVENNPDMVSKISDNTYQLKIPKDKTSEIYSKISGKELNVEFDSLIIEFVVGDDDYLKTVTVKGSNGSMNIKLDTNYFNYNKKFNIVLPKV